MPTFTVSVVLQLILALGLLNVWILRSHAATAYRGGSARTLQEEFAAYGLPRWAFYLVGALKVGIAVALLVGLWIPALVVPAAAGLVALMVGAITMHLKVGDSVLKSLPALLMLAMSGSLLGFALA